MPLASLDPRVVVSGLGVISPYGAGAKTLWAGLAAGACAIKPITLIDTEGFRSRIAAEINARLERVMVTAFRDVLRDINYQGWAIVEQDMYPAPFDKPLPIAKRTRAYLREIGIG